MLPALIALDARLLERDELAEPAAHRQALRGWPARETRERVRTTRRPAELGKHVCEETVLDVGLCSSSLQAQTQASTSPASGSSPDSALCRRATGPCGLDCHVGRLSKAMRCIVHNSTDRLVARMAKRAAGSTLRCIGARSYDHSPLAGTSTSRISWVNHCYVDDRRLPELTARGCRPPARRTAGLDGRLLTGLFGALQPTGHDLATLAVSRVPGSMRHWALLRAAPRGGNFWRGYLDDAPEGP